MPSRRTRASYGFVCPLAFFLTPRCPSRSPRAHEHEPLGARRLDRLLRRLRHRRRRHRGDRRRAALRADVPRVRQRRLVRAREVPERRQRAAALERKVPRLLEPVAHRRLVQAHALVPRRPARWDELQALGGGRRLRLAAGHPAGRGRGDGDGHVDGLAVGGLYRILYLHPAVASGGAAAAGSAARLAILRGALVARRARGAHDGASGAPPSPLLDRRQAALPYTYNYARSLRTPS